MGFHAEQFYIHGLCLRKGPRTENNIAKLKERFPDINIKNICDDNYIVIEKFKNDEDSGFYSEIERASHLRKTYTYSPDWDSPESEATKRDIEYLCGKKLDPLKIDPQLLDSLMELDLYIYDRKYYCHYIVGYVD